MKRQEMRAAARWWKGSKISMRGSYRTVSSDSQPSGAAEPGEGAFDHPAMPSQALATLDAAPRDARLDSTPAQCRAATREVTALVGMELGRSPLRSSKITSVKVVEKRVSEEVALVRPP